MASTKQWFSLLGSSILRTNLPKTSNLIYPLHPFPSSLHFPRHRCSSAAVSADSAQAFHPWPEWVTFVDCLKLKGYFSKTPPSNDAILYTDSKLLKDACLTFARQRFDLFNSLSSLDIQTIVEKGCPNLFRKVVNSAKRLRAHSQLDEGQVCGACNLRESCDRSYVVLTDDEATARTVDVVRILLLYALDPSVLSEGTISSDRRVIETSARRLLSELIELSDTVPAPEINTMPLRTKKDPTPRLRKESLKFDDDVYSQYEQMKSGDWNCSRCDFMNFARNMHCMKCQEEGPKKIDNNVEMKKGDWNCPECGFMNFSSKSSCLRCREPRPPRQLEPGEWECSSCNYVNFRRNTSCKKCNGARPSGRPTSCKKCNGARPSGRPTGRPSLGNTLFDDEPPAKKLEFGEWECPSCAYVNFRKNVTCRKCKCDRPRSGRTLS